MASATVDPTHKRSPPAWPGESLALHTVCCAAPSLPPPFQNKPTSAASHLPSLAMYVARLSRPAASGR
eukprot:366540-Chlamydomonas_euryale.AAC.1